MKRTTRFWQRRGLGVSTGGVMLALASACGGAEQRPGTDTGSAATATAAIATAATATPAVATASGGAGEQLYQRCATCHQVNGEGVAGMFPPLAGSAYATAANPAVPIRIVLHGLQGPITVKGTAYNGVMPAYGTGVEMTDEEVAAVVTYVRQSWGNGASAVTPQAVAKERAATSGAGAMTAESLKSLM